MLYASSHSYQVVDDQLVYVSVAIGQGQSGSSTVLLNGNSVCHGTAIANQPLGKGQDLRGKNLLVTSSMVINNPASNLTSNTVGLTGGTAPQNWTDSNSGSQGDNVVYLCAVQFT